MTMAHSPGGRIAAMAVFLLLGGGSSWGGRYDELYRAQAVVTGQGEENRAPGLAQSLEDVAVKVSGDPRLIGDPRLAAMGRDAEIFVKKFSYRDRLAGKPIHDEQGTYDRPHDLIVDFSRPRINAALRSLGREPWTRRRPNVAIVLSVRRGGQDYVVVSDGDRDRDMRDSLAAAAARVGLTIALPTAADLAAGQLGGVVVDRTPTADMQITGAEPAASAPIRGVPLTCALTWSDEAHGWIAEWRIVSQGRVYAWRIRGVGFDDAFRNGLRGAAQVLSGNGQPE